MATVSPAGFWNGVLVTEYFYGLGTLSARTVFVFSRLYNGAVRSIAVT